MADAGSGVPPPPGCRTFPVKFDMPEKPEEEADVGWEFLPSTMVKLSFLE